MRKRRTSIAARILAPLAIVAAGLAIWAVVHGEVDKATKSASTTTTTVKKSKKKSKPKGGKKVYVVKSGDVLSAIAVKTHVTPEQIEKYNPKLDANTLHPGQRIKLVP